MNKEARIVRRTEVARRLGIATITLDRWVQRGLIHQPNRYGTHVTGWPESYIDSLVANGMTEEVNDE